MTFSTDSSDLDRCKFRARVRIDSAGVSHGAKVIRGVVVIVRKAPVYMNITMKEFVTVRRGILRFVNDLHGHTVCLYEDNQIVVAFIKNHTSSSPLLMNELCLFMTLMEQLDIRLVPARFGYVN